MRTVWVTRQDLGSKGPLNSKSNNMCGNCILKQNGTTVQYTFLYFDSVV